ncbi:hypothetical protein [Pseudorhodoferax sp. Leaf267]|uniref:hypothetical protein n=1 Tax=Pseudorhodoferax sp. Leaf267 TaxID=1736316 RepID=UPI0006F403AD|nr:hypothetical protein [Pseudorhodoferax sp. Leaf267]KQP14707.1 hypothetical protein ASF43_11560 [Pseudorhodoferax sp. Leaf267]
MRNWIATLLLCAAQAALAQPNPFEGQWTARFKTFGQDREAKLDVQPPGGTWQVLYLPAGADICFKLKAPIEVLRSTSDEMEFVVQRSKTLAGCADIKPIVLRRIDDKTLEGAFADGIPLRLTR